MNTAIQTEYAASTYKAAFNRKTGPSKPGVFQRAIEAGMSVTEAEQLQTRSAEDYKKQLERRFGPVTLESVGHDQKSLDAVGKRMRGNDIYIAPNIFDDMVDDLETAAYYEKKISYFFTDVIPNGEAYAKSVGLTFEPCGVVIHEDGTVTYICGGGDPPEKVAKVEAENRARQEQRTKRRRELAELAAGQAAQRRELWEHLAQAAARQTAVHSELPTDASELRSWIRIQSLALPPLHSVSKTDSGCVSFHIL